jgi:hypothetical protein
MAGVPSIKGSIFAFAAEDLAKLVSVGKVPAGDLARRLTAEDRAILDQPIQLTGWYPVAAYDRMLALLLEYEGHGSIAYLKERGVRSADRLIQAGIYAQMEYLNRVQVQKAADPQQRFQAYGRDLRLLSTLSGSILNFSRWQPKPDPRHPDRYVIEVSEAEAYPELLCWTTDGWINRMASQHGDDELWRWKRVRPDLIVFEMTRSL